MNISKQTTQLKIKQNEKKHKQNINNNLRLVRFLDVNKLSINNMIYCLNLFLLLMQNCKSAMH